MASVIKVETFDTDITSSGSTYTLTNSVGSTSKAFVRIPSSTDRGSGPTGSTGNAAPNITGMGVALTGTTTLTFYKDDSTSMKKVGEVWRYTGSASGVDEFIVRGRAAISITGTSASSAISGISSDDDCVPFITGYKTAETSTSNFEMTTFAAHMDGSGNVVVSRNNSGTTCTVYVTVVEFTGSNWSVGHGISSSHDSSNETVTLNTDSSGSGGSTFDVGSWSSAFIEASMEGDSGETGLADVMALVYPQTDTTKVTFSVTDGDSAARNDGTGYVHVVKNTSMTVSRAYDSDISEGNGSYGTAPAWPTGASTSRSIDELALEWTVSTSGTGTAHARARLIARITAASGTISHWVHRSGNTIKVRYGVIDLSSVDGTVHPVITDMEDEQIDRGETDNVITGVNFGATQGTGKVELGSAEDYTGTKVTQSIDSWSATSIQFDVAEGTLSDGAVWIFVTTNAGSRSPGYEVNLGLTPYPKVVENMSPDHFWKFQNTYDDEIAGNSFNNVTSGSPTFVTTPKLARDDTHAFKLDGTTAGQHIEASNSNYMNNGAQTRRYMGGWIEVDRINKELSVIYEEGAQINNIAFLMGFGNILMAQCADTSDDYVQAYSDFNLTVDRPYHIFFKFEASAYDGEFRLFIDGVKQTRTNGNPWTPSDLDSHTGDISMGFNGDSAGLEVGGTDIQFATPTKCFYSNWATWHGVSLTESAQIRVNLFEKGARADVTITSDTETNMQTALDVYADTVRGDLPLCIKVEECTAGDFELRADNITFNDRASIQVQYTGTDTLTWVNENGSATTSSKLSTPYGGTITVVESVPVTVTVKDITTGSVISGARVLVEADSGGDLTAGTDIIDGTTNASGVITANLDYTSDQPIKGHVREGDSPYYRQSDIVGTVTTAGYDVTILMIPDT